jgi:hypothetical protein
MSEETEQTEAIYKIYPRKVGKLAALKAIRNAVSFLVQSEKISPLDARRKLYRVTLAYSRSPVGKQQDKSRIPHPSTWFNQGRYLDDPQEWQHVSGGFDRGTVPTGKADSNMGVLAKIIGEGKRSGRDGEDGELPTSQGGRDNPQILLPGA